jgi:hypothetical protein
MNEKTTLNSISWSKSRFFPDIESPIWAFCYFVNFSIRFRFTVNIAISPYNPIPNRPEEKATSYPCLCFSSLFFASIFVRCVRLVLGNNQVIKFDIGT